MLHTPEDLAAGRRGSLSEDVEARAPLPAWLQLLAPGTSICALGVLGFVCTAGLLSRVNMPGKPRVLAAFLVGALLLPPLCAAIQILIVRPDSRSPTSRPAEMLICWAAIALLLALAAFPLVVHVVGGGREYLRHQARVVLGLLTTPSYLIAATVLLGIGVTGAILMTRKRPWVRGVSRAPQVAMFVLAFSLASFALFRIDLSNRYLNFFVGLVFEPPFSAEQGSFGLGRAFALAVLGIGAVAVLMRLEISLVERGSAWLQAARTTALWAATALTVLFFFDFSLANDPLHYLTNVGPALHFLQGGTPMVDVFSQYGPGPVLITALAFRIGPMTFGTPQLTVQVFNLAFYVVWLVCLYRMSRLKLAGLLLGVFSIALWFAAWGRGYGNVNDGPSVAGFRYLPALTMVLALSCLRPPRRHSAFTALSTFAAGLWSIETLIGTLGIHAAFLGLLGLRDRALVRLAADAMRATVPVAAALLVMTAGTLVRAGTGPDFGTYLAFLSVYNMLSWPIAAVADPRFFGWLPMWMVVFLVSADACIRVFTPAAQVTRLDETDLFYRFVPMAMLLVFQAAYFVARSVDYTLLMALLAFCAIAIPGMLAFTVAAASARGPARALAVIPVAIGLWSLTFTSVSLFRERTPYSLLVHECRDLGRCTPGALLRGLRDTMKVRGVLESLRRPIPDRAFDTEGIVRDAVSMIETLGGREPKVTVLLGPLQGGLVASEIALMYTGRWHRWPWSYTLTDGYVPQLAHRIVASPVRLREGELVLVRRTESSLGWIEAGILQRIRTEATLCRVPHPSKEVVAYRVAGAAGCPSGSTVP